MIDSVESLGQVDEYGCTVMSLIDCIYDSVEGTVGFKMVGDLFVNLAFEDFRDAG
jgi:hypothetical protein